MGQPRTVNLLDRPPRADLAALNLRGANAPAMALPTVNDPYPVSTDIPVPSRPGKQSRAAAFPWAKLEVGHSFLVPGDRSYKTANFWVKWAMKQWPTKRFIYRKVEGGRARVHPRLHRRRHGRHQVLREDLSCRPTGADAMTIVVKGHVAQVTAAFGGMIEVSVQTAQAECGQVVVLKVPRQHAAHWLVGSAVQMTAYTLPQEPTP